MLLLQCFHEVLIPLITNVPRPDPHCAQHPQMLEKFPAMGTASATFLSADVHPNTKVEHKRTANSKFYQYLHKPKLLYKYEHKYEYNHNMRRQEIVHAK